MADKSCALWFGTCMIFRKYMFGENVDYLLNYYTNDYNKTIS